MIAPIKREETVPIIKSPPGTLTVTGQIDVYYENTELFEKYFGNQKDKE